MSTLFEAYPLDGERTLSNGAKVSTPYHVYEGSILLIGGTADPAPVRALLSGQDVQPVETTDGRVLAALWMCNFTRANLGAHRELQFSIFVTRQRTAAVRAHRFVVLEVMTIRPQTYMMCHGLWNDTANVVAYNRELLGLNARLMSSHLEDKGEIRQFEFKDGEYGTILSGQVGLQRRQSPGAGFALTRAFKFADFLRISALPWLSMAVVNPKLSDLLPENRIAQAHAAGSRRAVRFFDATKDSLSFGDTPYCTVNFRPDFVYQLEGCNFVYLMPEKMP